MVVYNAIHMDKNWMIRYTHFHYISYGFYENLHQYTSQNLRLLKSDPEETFRNGKLWTNSLHRQEQSTSVKYCNKDMCNTHQLKSKLNNITTNILTCTNITLFSAISHFLQGKMQEIWDQGWMMLACRSVILLKRVNGRNV